MPFDLATAKPVGGFDLSTAKPVEKVAAASPAETAEAPENPTSLKNILGAAIEPNLSMLSSGLLTPVAGIAGLGAQLNKTLGIDPNVDPAEVVDKVKGMAYQPHTTGGKNAAEVLGLPGEALHWLTEKVNESPLAKGNPVAQAGYATLIEGVPQALGMKGGVAAAGKGGFLPNGKGISPEVRMLANKGVDNMTPGQIRGGFVDTAEQKLSSVPLVGDVIKNARGKAVEKLDNARINDALTHISKSLSKEVKGHDALREASNHFDDAYNQILPKMKGDLDSAPPATPTTLPAVPGTPPPPVTNSLRAELNGVKTLAKNLPAEQAATVNNFIDNEVIGKFTQYGRASGRTLQEIRETLNAEVDAHKRSSNPHDRKVSLALAEVQNSIDRMIERENPTLAPQYKKIREGYAKLSISRQAGGLKGAKGGVATPSQFLGAVRAKDRSKGKKKFSEGRALQQPLAKAGMRLGNTVPDSGTAGRVALMEALAGGGAAAGGILGHPLLTAGALSVPAIYSQMGLRALQPMLKGDVRVAPAAAGAMATGALGQNPEPALELAGAEQ